MNFQNLKNIEDYQFYLDLALKRSDEKARLLRQSIKLKSVSRLIKSKRIEIERLRNIREILSMRLYDIHSKFPSIDALPEFYRQLVRTTIDQDKLKKALGSVAWAQRNIEKITKQYTGKMKSIDDESKITELNKLRRSYLGRISSILKQVSPYLKDIETARRTMKEYPAIKTSLFTVAIAGFPNVGKSTLLSQITSSDPEINTYAFTTKKLNTGYLKGNTIKIQLIDTPGTLARNRMNDIEKKADLALKYVADIIVYIYDLTEEYSIDEQHKLLTNINELDKPILIYVSKQDVLEKEKINNFIIELKKNIKCKIFLQKEDLVKEIFNIQKNFDTQNI